VTRYLPTGWSPVNRERIREEDLVDRQRRAGRGGPDPRLADQVYGELRVVVRRVSNTRSDSLRHRSMTSARTIQLRCPELRGAL